jgi:hypothetical protein
MRLDDAARGYCPIIERLPTAGTLFPSTGMQDRHGLTCQLDANAATTAMHRKHKRKHNRH